MSLTFGAKCFCGLTVVVAIFALLTRLSDDSASFSPLYSKKKQVHFAAFPDVYNQDITAVSDVPVSDEHTMDVTKLMPQGFTDEATISSVNRTNKSKWSLIPNANDFKRSVYEENSMRRGYNGRQAGSRALGQDPYSLLREPVRQVKPSGYSDIELFNESSIRLSETIQAHDEQIIQQAADSGQSSTTQHSSLLGDHLESSDAFQSSHDWVDIA